MNDMPPVEGVLCGFQEKEVFSKILYDAESRIAGLDIGLQLLLKKEGVVDPRLRWIKCPDAPPSVQLV